MCSAHPTPTRDGKVFQAGGEEGGGGSGGGPRIIEGAPREGAGAGVGVFRKRALWGRGVGHWEGEEAFFLGGGGWGEGGGLWGVGGGGRERRLQHLVPCPSQVAGQMDSQHLPPTTGLPQHWPG